MYCFFVYKINSNPIVGTYAYARNEEVKYIVKEDKYIFESEPEVLLRFKNGCYVFEGEGSEFDEIVSLYGNNVKCDFKEIESDSVRLKKYYLKDSDEYFPITFEVETTGKLTLRIGTTNTPTRRFHRIDQ